MIKFGTLKIGQKLESVRKDRAMSQAEFAALLDVTPQTYSRYERNENGVEYKKVMEIAEKLNMPLQEFLPDTSTFSNEFKYGGKGGIFFGDFNYYESGANKKIEQDTDKELLIHKLEQQSEKINTLEKLVHTLIEQLHLNKNTP